MSFVAPASPGRLPDVEDGVSIELARVRDAIALAAMSRDEVEAGLSWRWTPRAIARAVQAPETEVVLARRDGALAGFGILELGHETAHLVLFAVAPEHRRRGVGRALFEWLHPLAVNAGLGRIRLEVRSRNHEGQAFYRKLGFEPARRLQGYYQGVEDAVEMILRLSPHPAR